MELEHANTLIANLKSAKTPEEISAAHTLALIAVVDCQRKTADRVKELVAQRDELYNTAKGARWAWSMAAAAAGALASAIGLILAWR